MENRIKSQFTSENTNFPIHRRVEAFNNRHNSWINQKIELNRHLSNLDLSTDINNISNMNVDENLTINLENVTQSLSFLHQRNYSDKMKTKNFLKLLRKELSKNSLDSEQFQFILSYDNQDLFIILTEFLFDFKNSEIQLETIWILNNLCIYANQFNFKQIFYKIHNILITFMQSEANFSNSGIKNLILEKYFSLIGNLILFEDNIIEIYIDNNIMFYLIKNLNSSVRSLRYIILQTINNIIEIVNEKFDKNSYNIIINSLFADNEIIYYYKFIFSRLEIRKNFDESYEFLWLMNSFSKLNLDLFINLFIKDEKINQDFINKLFYFVGIDKLHQPCLRILSNLLCHNLINLQLKEMIIKEKSIFSFFSNFIQYLELGNKYSFLVIRDIFFLLKNLCLIDPFSNKDMILIIILNFLKNLNRFSNWCDKEIKEKIYKNLIQIFYSIFTCEDMIIEEEDLQNLFNFVTNFHIEFENEIKELEIKLIILDFIIILCGRRKIEISNQIIEEIETIKNNQIECEYCDKWNFRIFKDIKIVSHSKTHKNIK